MRIAAFVASVAAVSMAGCGTAATPAACEIPSGCLSVDRSSGTCECTSWKTVSDQVVPLKFLVTGVVMAPPGNQSGVGYGNFTSATPPGQSQLGTRIRAVLRDAQGKRTPLSVEVPTASLGQYGLTVLGSTTLAVAMVPGDGMGLYTQVDLYSPAYHQVLVWVNPTLRLIRDAGGHVRGVWGWSGTCFWPPGATGGNGCSAPNILRYELGEMDGTFLVPSFDEAFVETLTPDERASIRGYDRLASSPPPTAADLDGDPRFLRLGEVALEPAGSLAPSTTWTPCPGPAGDDDFPVFASTEISLSASETVIVEQSWLSSSIGCSPQSPGLVLGTTTSGCSMSSTVYVDRMFGTLAFLPERNESACTKS
ncbi:MAG: hypothetical protein ACXWLA_01715 [Myxococcaceae bacterium]